MSGEGSKPDVASLAKTRNGNVGSAHICKEPRLSRLEINTSARHWKICTHQLTTVPLSPPGLLSAFNAYSAKYPRVETKPAQAVWPRVQIAARRRHVGMAEGCLHLG
jgi:hypothetical protein